MYKLNEEKMFFDIADGQAVVINFTTGMYYGTSTLGSAVLEQLVKGVRPDRIADTVRKIRGCPDDFEERLRLFVDQLLGKEILVRAAGSSENDPEFCEKAFEDGFVLSLDEFAEVQDLLLADPVEEIDAEQGWPILVDGDQ